MSPDFPTTSATAVDPLRAPPRAALRASLLTFTDDGQAGWRDDALVVVGADGRVAVADDYDAAIAAAHQRWPDLPIEDHRGRVLAPGFIDSHVHYPQIDIIGSPASGLLPWLERYTFPAETRFSDEAHASEVAAFFLSELLRHGVTSALVFATAHPAAVNALFTQAEQRGLGLISGKVLQDRHSPDGLRDDTEGSLRDSEALLQRWHGRGRLGYALTPRFAPTSSPRQLAGLGELAQQHPSVWVHSHLAESPQEVRWVAELFPARRSYLDVYDKARLVRRRSVYAHCLHLDQADRRRMVAAQALAAVCPTSNLFLGSGLFDFAAAADSGLRWALASDVGGGTTLSPFRTMLAAYKVGRLGGHPPSPAALWFHHTRGAALGLDLGDQIGDVRVGLYGDLVLLDPRATPLLARRTAQCGSLDEWLFAMLTLADDRAVAQVRIAGQVQAP